jgi:hypothetical protein
VKTQQRLGLIGVDQSLAVQFEQAELRMLDALRRAVRARHRVLMPDRVAAVSHNGPPAIPPAWVMIAVVLGTLLVVTALTAVAARIGARCPPAEILQSETA